MAVVQRIEEMVLNHLLYNEEYYRKVYPHLVKEYFHERVEYLLFNVIKEYSDKYAIAPSIDTVSLLINQKDGITEDEINDINEYISELLLSPIKTSIIKSDIETTEQFCQDKAMYNAILDSMSIINGDDEKRDNNAIPDIMKDALKVGFDQSIGLDYSDAEERYDRLHETRQKIPFDVDALNVITKGGLEPKTLNCVLASTGVGKTIFMCHCAASAITYGNNVLYITMEMSEEKISERIDANLMDVALDDFDEMKRDIFISKFKKVVNGNGFLSKIFGIKKKQKLGKLFIKEFPTGAGNVNHFRHLLDELKLKKGFIPDFIIIDYINICSSTRILPMSGSYTYIKSIAEEIRGLGVEYKVPVLSGTQTNRGGFSNSDVEMTDTSESIGLPQTLDLYFALMTNEILEKSGRIAVKQLKNRYRDVNKNKYFTIGIDKPKMRFFHVEDAFDRNDNETLDDLSVIEDDSLINHGITKKVEKTNRFEGINI